MNLYLPNLYIDIYIYKEIVLRINNLNVMIGILCTSTINELSTLLGELLAILF